MISKGVGFLHRFVPEVRTKPNRSNRIVTRSRPARAISGLIFGLFLTFQPAFAQQAGPQGPEEGPLRRQLWLVPSQDKNVPMRTVIFRPRGSGPFPLVIINHGSVQNTRERADYSQPVFLAASEFFVERGYAVVVPQRPGHGQTGGPYFEANSPSGKCSDADYRKSGSGTADSIAAAIAFLTKQNFVRPDGVIVVGQSAGGWGSLALASRNPRDVKLIINFAGGRGGHAGGKPNTNCAADKLIDAARAFGSTARIPVLAIYTQNDSYFSAELSRKMMDAYRAAGGKVEYKLLPAFKEDGHSLLGNRDGRPLWAPTVDAFLKAHP
jgi:dienelactone hydrolase